MSKKLTYEELEQRVRELEKAHEDLKELNTELKNATRLKSEFLSNMSHELRTPLNSIIGFSGRVIKKAGDSLPEKQLENLKTVLRNSHHLLGLINSLLDISKIEAGRMEVFPEEFRLNLLISEVTQMIQPLITDKGLELITDIPDKQINLSADKIKLKQILINLVTQFTVAFTPQSKKRSLE